jgi:hypothetical protein
VIGLRPSYAEDEIEVVSAGYKAATSLRNRTEVSRSPPHETWRLVVEIAHFAPTKMPVIIAVCIGGKEPTKHRTEAMSNVGRVLHIDDGDMMSMFETRCSPI